MDLKAHLFLLLLRLGIGTIKASDKECELLLSLSIKEWKELMTMAELHGVAAIATDGLQELYNTRQNKIEAAKTAKHEWMLWVLEIAGLMNQYEQQNAKQMDVIVDVSDILSQEGVKMMVFKGQANAMFYPIPSHRAPGDIDCYLFGETEKGDNLLVAHGAQIDNRWYRHSKILYKGEIIENHRKMSHTRGSRKKKEMEKEFVCLAKQAKVNSEKVKDNGLGGGLALIPTAQFNACFLTYHGLHHFLSEGLRMKQILDWAMFLKEEQEKVDWNAYWDFCRRYKLNRFAEVMNYIVEQYLNILCGQNEKVRANYKNIDGDDCDDKWIKNIAERFLQSSLYDNEYLFNSGKSDWTVRWLLVRNTFTRDRWKFQHVAQESALKVLWQNTFGFLFDKD